MRRPVLAVLLLSTSLLTLSACDGKAMSVQDPIAAIQPLPIERDGKLASFGSWTNERTKGGAIRTVSVGAGPWGAEAVQQDFDYSSSGGATGFTGTCSFDASGQNVAFAEFGESSAFACTITPAGGDAWAPIDPATNYLVVSNNYVRQGGDGFKMFVDAAKAYDFGPDLADVVAEFMAANGAYTPYLDGRITKK